MLTSRELVSRLGGVIDETLSPLIPAGSSCALLDFPFHGNVGDSAIWLGEKRWLAQRGVSIVYEADALSFRESAIRALGPNVVLLITGGGSFGDVWPLAQSAREKWLSLLADRRIIQLPQTVHFENEANVARARAVIDKLADFTLLCRDSRSLETARANFDCPGLLCPDMAFALGSQAASVEPEVDCVWLGRDDKESSGMSGALPPGVIREDWLTDEPSSLPQERWEALRRVTSSETLDVETMAAFSRVNDALAEARLARGLKLLSRGRGVVTDRLHGHILSTLLAKPHVLIDNSYGKNRTFYETWSKDCDAVQLIEPGDASAAAIVDSLRTRLD